MRTRRLFSEVVHSPRSRCCRSRRWSAGYNEPVSTWSALLRLRANQLDDAVAVARPPAQRLKDDEVERALQELDTRRGRVFGRHGRLYVDSLPSAK